MSGLLGGILVSEVAHEEAEPVLEESLSIRQQVLPSDDDLVFNSMSLLGASLAGQEKYAEAAGRQYKASFRALGHGADGGRECRAGGHGCEGELRPGEFFPDPACAGGVWPGRRRGA